MAAPLKRKHEIDEENIEIKKAALDGTFRQSKQLKEFLNWCQKNDFQLSTKVCVTRKGSCAQFGMIALENIAEGYSLFQVPRVSLLQPSNSKIGTIIQDEQEKLTESNQWIPLLLTLLYEQSQPDSKWKPYMDLVPDFDALDLPMFWEASDVDKLLKGTGVDLAVRRDQKRIEEDFNSLVKPFFQRHCSQLGNSCDQVGLEQFKKMVAFVMSYSFTEPCGKSEGNSSGDGGDEDEDGEEEPPMLPPMMVPMADMLNHVTQNNAKLTFGTQALKMVTTKPVKKGEEIFNTYGQVSNLHLMHMYGFAEPFPNNTNDVVEIPVERLKEATDALCEDQTLALDCLQEKWKCLIEQDVIADDDETIVLGCEGIINDDVCSQVLKVLSMDKSQFQDYVEREGWSDAESESSVEDGSTLDFDKIPRLDPKWKDLLKRTAMLHLQIYPTSLADDEALVPSASNVNSRERFALYTAHGQKKLVMKLIEACSK